MQAETRNVGRARFYPCRICVNDHASITTLLDVIASPPLMGWLSKNGVAKLNTLWESVGRRVSDPDTLNKISVEAETLWCAKEDTQFWKSGKQIGKAAADVGQLAHAWIEAHLQNKAPTLDSLLNESRTVVQGFLEWEKAHKLETLKTEQSFYHCRLGYAGTADWVGHIDGELTLMDWKSSNGIYPNYVIQAWGYALADEFQHGDRLYRQVGIGRFGKKGDWEVKLFKRSEFPGIEIARDVITGCKAVFDFNQKWENVFPYQKKEVKRETAPANPSGL